MHRSDHRRRQRHITTLELICVLVVLAALLGLVAWILTHRGGVGGFLGALPTAAGFHRRNSTSSLGH